MKKRKRSKIFFFKLLFIKLHGLLACLVMLERNFELRITIHIMTGEFSQTQASLFLSKIQELEFLLHMKQSSGKGELF